MYKINEIFYSLQMEGYNAGRPAIFIRFAGCNLTCPWCDTDHSEKMQMDKEQILVQLEQYPCYNVIFTGGEPLLQDYEPLLNFLIQNGYSVWLETNGTIDTQANFDWITMSPKGVTKLTKWNEVKIVIDKNVNLDSLVERIIQLENTWVAQVYLQPCWNPNNVEETKLNTQRAVDIVKELPRCRLSLQGHKLIDIQ